MHPLIFTTKKTFRNLDILSKDTTRKRKQRQLRTDRDGTTGCIYSSKNTDLETTCKDVHIMVFHPLLEGIQVSSAMSRLIFVLKGKLLLSIAMYDTQLMQLTIVPHDTQFLFLNPSPYSLHIDGATKLKIQNVKYTTDRQKCTTCGVFHV